MTVQPARLSRFSFAIFLFLIGICLSCAAQRTTASPQADRTTVEAEMKSAIEAVQRIVNQRVPSFVRTPEMNVSTYRPGWFHEGAIKPDFNNVDVRRTRETSYDGKEYVTSDLNPGVVFHGDDLEFNSMTKYFYTDRTVPKKKLTEAEMLEINRLYRIIGRCEQELSKLK
jgi:hypothetical protein